MAIPPLTILQTDSHEAFAQLLTTSLCCRVMAANCPQACNLCGSGAAPESPVGAACVNRANFCSQMADQVGGASRDNAMQLCAPIPLLGGCGMTGPVLEACTNHAVVVALLDSPARRRTH